MGSRRHGDLVDLVELIGRRVALRHRLPTPDGSPLYTDAVGELADDGPAAVLVHTRRGVVRVARDAVVAVREIPPPRTRRPSLAAVTRLEHICADAWPALVDEPLGQWRLRAADGFTGRANATLVAGDPGRPIAEALAEVRRFAAEHGIPARLQVPLESPWHAAVTEHGWIRDDAHPAGAEVAVLVNEVPELTTPMELVDPVDAAARPPDGVRVTIGERPDDDWWRLTLEGADGSASEITRAQRHVLTAPGLAHVGYGLAWLDADGPLRGGVPDGGAPGRAGAGGASAGGADLAGRSAEAIGAMRLAVVDGHLHVARLTVRADHRRLGVAVAMMGAAARWAAARSARWCVLQVAEHNAPALALYRRLGFRRHHGFQFLRPGAPV